MTAKELLNESINVLRHTDTVEAAVGYLNGQGLTELPVVKNKFLYNYARIENLNQVDDHSLRLDQVIAENVHAPAVFHNQHLYEIVPIMAVSELSVIAVLGENKEFEGTIDQRRINKLITESMTYRGLGAVVVLDLEDRDFSPASICRWVEENGAKVIGMMVKSEEMGRLKVNLKLNTTVSRNIVSTFQRQGYKVENVYLSEDQNGQEDREIDMVLKFFDL
jgi:predicted transcriptional regulator